MGNSAMTLPDITPSEFATILCGLRALQNAIQKYDDDDGARDIARMFPDYFEDVKPIGDSAIDDLCERLNTEKVPASVVLTPEKRDRAWKKFTEYAGTWTRMAFDVALDTLYDEPCAPTPANSIASAPVAYEPDAQTRRKPVGRNGLRVRHSWTKSKPSIR